MANIFFKEPGPRFFWSTLLKFSVLLDRLTMTTAVDEDDDDDVSGNFCCCFETGTKGADFAVSVRGTTTFSDWAIGVEDAGSCSEAFLPVVAAAKAFDIFPKELPENTEPSTVAVLLFVSPSIGGVLCVCSSDFILGPGSDFLLQLSSLSLA